MESPQDQIPEQSAEVESLTVKVDPFQVEATAKERQEEEQDEEGQDDDDEELYVPSDSEVGFLYLIFLLKLWKYAHISSTADAFLTCSASAGAVLSRVLQREPTERVRARRGGGGAEAARQRNRRGLLRGATVTSMQEIKTFFYVFYFNLTFHHGMLVIDKAIIQ